VIHLGALGSVPRSINDPQTTNSVNVNGTLNVLEAARLNGVKHVVSASSSSVYGANPQIPKIETMTTMPVSPYAVSKLATEAYTTAYSRSFGMSTLAFRFFNVFGPYQRSDHAYAAVIPRFLEAIKNGTPLTVHGDGTQSRDFTSVHSVTDALTQAALAQISSPTPVNLAFGRRFTLNQLIEILEGIHGAPLDRVAEPSRAGDVPHSQASPDRLNELLPSVEAPSFEDALAETYRWYFAFAG
jgi:UDP-glucose 4-epimerase